MTDYDDYCAVMEMDELPCQPDAEEYPEPCQWCGSGQHHTTCPAVYCGICGTLLDGKHSKTCPDYEPSALDIQIESMMHRIKGTDPAWWDCKDSDCPHCRVVECPF